VIQINLKQPEHIYVMAQMSLDFITEGMNQDDTQNQVKQTEL